MAVEPTLSVKPASKGNVLKTLRLLLILKLAYALYRRYLAEIGARDAA